MSPPRKPKKPKEQQPEGITKITVKGFKSLANETSIDIRPLTILAGANSSGKSSIMQPLLLLKQTLEAPYDPGPLKLDGPIVWLTSGAQLLSVGPSRDRGSTLEVGLGVAPDTAWHWSFTHRPGSGFGIPEVRARSGGVSAQVGPGKADVHAPEAFFEVFRHLKDRAGDRDVQWRVVWHRFVLAIRAAYGAEHETGRLDVPLGTDPVGSSIRGSIHVPGHRGLPERAYPRTAVGPLFPGTFEPYTGSMILDWQETDDPRRRRVAADLAAMTLADDVTARAIGDVGVEVFVPIRPVGSPQDGGDTANIADVGTSVQHVLPVVVALHAADPGRLVYIEQPEIHLHPRAQVALAQLLVDAANRGVRVVAETHSSLLLVAIQTLVAKQRIATDDVSLHWFTRNRRTGVTKVRTARITQTGSFGAWPEDFSRIELGAHGAYLEAAHEQRRAG
jgi:hypothetical protein